MKNIRSALFLSLGGLVIAFVICESLLRMCHVPTNKNLYYDFKNPELRHDGFVFDAYLFWKAKPFSTVYGRQLNNKGFRGSNFKEEKDKDTIRVVCLGDSCTFQAEVEDKNTVRYDQG